MNFITDRITISQNLVFSSRMKEGAWGSELSLKIKVAKALRNCDPILYLLQLLSCLMALSIFKTCVSRINITYKHTSF